MIAPKIIAATFALGMTSGAMAGLPAGQLGLASLPMLQGGILTVAVIGLVAGIRLVKRKKNRKD